jgi:hypothetical protein
MSDLPVLLLKSASTARRPKRIHPSRDDWFTTGLSGYRLVSTICMIPLNELDEHKAIPDLAARAARSIMSACIGHPGVERPH